MTSHIFYEFNIFENGAIWLAERKAVNQFRHGYLEFKNVPWGWYRLFLLYLRTKRIWNFIVVGNRRQKSRSDSFFNHDWGRLSPMSELVNRGSNALLRCQKMLIFQKKFSLRFFGFPGWTLFPIRLVKIKFSEEIPFFFFGTFPLSIYGHKLFQVWNSWVQDFILKIGLRTRFLGIKIFFWNFSFFQYFQDKKILKIFNLNIV